MVSGRLDQPQRIELIKTGHAASERQLHDEQGAQLLMAQQVQRMAVARDLPPRRRQERRRFARQAHGHQHGDEHQGGGGDPERHRHAPMQGRARQDRTHQPAQVKRAIQPRHGAQAQRSRQLVGQHGARHGAVPLQQTRDETGHDEQRIGLDHQRPGRNRMADGGAHGRAHQQGAAAIAVGQGAQQGRADQQAQRVDGQRQAEQQFGGQAEEIVEGIRRLGGEQRWQDRVWQRGADGRQQRQQTGGGNQDDVFHAGLADFNLASIRGHAT